jgi:uncharacterized protein (DUF1697 family)
MAKFIALYRGINVGGKNMVKMEALRALHERLGHREVNSYVQSGNLVFTATGSAEAIARKLAAAFADALGFAAQVLVVESKRWREFVQGNPYAKLAADKPQAVHAAICVGEPNAAALQALLTKTGGNESFVVGQGIIYVHAPEGLGKSKFAAGMERASGVTLTLRNWRTVEALWQMTNGDG